MTLAQLEARVAALEETVERLQTQVNIAPQATSPSNGGWKEETEEDFIPGTEHDLVVTVPPKESFHLWGRIVSIQPGPPGLGLSDAEWGSLGLEDEDE